MYSGIPYLQNQIKTVIERSQSFMLVTGQVIIIYRLFKKT